MNKEGWLCNAVLTWQSGTKTFWHNFLEWIPNLKDKTYGDIEYSLLADKLEADAKNHKPDYIIRNGTFFRKLNITDVKTISLILDFYENDLEAWRREQRQMQIETMNSSTLVIFISEYTYLKYKDEIKVPYKIIPIGIDFELFRPLNNKQELIKKYNLLENSILFIGDNTDNPKGFNLLMDIVNNTNFNYCFVMKSDYNIIHPRIKVINQISHEKLVEVINCCCMLICTSKEETQHLAGLEAGACNIPIVATNVGLYYNRPDGKWGRTVKTNNYIDFRNKMCEVFDDYKNLQPREYFLNEGYDLNSFKNKFLEAIKDVI